VNSGGAVRRYAGRVAGTALAAAWVAAAVGLIEGTALAVVYDPFGARPAARALSVLLFVCSYFLAGGLAAALLCLPFHLTRFSRAATAIVCGVIGLAYARSWAMALAGIPHAIHPVVAVAAAAGALVFGLAGAAAARWVPGAPRRAAMGGAGVLSTGVMMLAAVSPAAQPRARVETPAPKTATAAPAPESSPGSAAAGTPRHLLFILADTLRADHLSLYGYQRATSPALTRLAAGGVTFTSAIAQKPKTSPSVASLFTGTYPHTHGIVNCRTPLPRGAVTLAEVLRERRFATHSIVANSNIGTAFQFDQGFESVDEIWTDAGAIDASRVTDHALKWLEDRGAAHDTRPFFLYVHYVDPHAPYGAPSPWTDRFVDDRFYGKLAHVEVKPGPHAVGSIRAFVSLPERTTDVDYYVARYDAEVAYLDEHVGRLLEGLRRLGLGQDTLVVFTADHGEALSEHDVFFSHGGFAYDDAARVPLVMASPGRIPAGRVAAGVVQTVSLAPTVLQALGLPRPASMEVEGFWDLASGASPAPQDDEPAAFIEADTVPGSLRTAIRTGRWKLIDNPKGFDRTTGYFDLTTK